MCIITTKRKTEQIAVPIYFNPNSFQAVCADAARVGKRGVLLLPQKVKEHGFDGEKVWQRKGIGKFLKFCWQCWKDNESERLVKVAEIARKEKELLEEKKKAGMV